MADEQLSGASRAAVFLLSLGEEGAASVLKHMEPREVQNVGEAMTQLSEVSNESLLNVIHDFVSEFGSGVAMGIDPQGYVKRALSVALGENKSKRMFNRIMRGEDSKGMGSLKWMDAQSVAAMLREEHPQICAIVLSSLDGDHAAEVLKHLPAERTSQIMMRVANLETIHPGALEELDQILQSQLAERSDVPPSKVEGLRIAADIIGFLDSEMETSVIDSISDTDAELGDSIRDLMFIFDNLITVTDRDMQRLLQEISSEDLVVALKGASEEMRDKFLSNMSQRAAELLRDDMETKGPVRLADVESIQKEIVKTAMSLSDEGEITIGRSGGDDFV